MSKCTCASLLLEREGRKGKERGNCICRMTWRKWKLHIERNKAGRRFKPTLSLGLGKGGKGCKGMLGCGTSSRSVGAYREGACLVFECWVGTMGGVVYWRGVSAGLTRGVRWREGCVCAHRETGRWDRRLIFPECIKVLYILLLSCCSPPTPAATLSWSRSELHMTRARRRLVKPGPGFGCWVTSPSPGPR